MVNQTSAAPTVAKQRTSYLSIIFWIFLFTGVFIFLLTTTLTAYHKNQKLKGYAQQVVVDIKELQENNHELRKKIHALKTDPFYLEMVIRRELRMLGDNEIVIPR